MAEQWKEGEVVRLKSGGPKMIVDRVVHYSDDSTSVYCVWFDDNKKMSVCSQIRHGGCYASTHLESR